MMYVEEEGVLRRAKFMGYEFKSFNDLFRHRRQKYYNTTKIFHAT